MARRSQIYGRLLAVLESGRSRRPLGRGGALVAAAGGAAFVLPLAMLWSAGAAPGPAAQIEMRQSVGAGEPAAIAAVYSELRAAVQRSDAEAVAALYTADGEIDLSGLDAMRGRQKIARFFRQSFGEGMTDLDIHTYELFRAGDMLCELGGSEALARGGAALSSRRYMTLWKKEDGKWRIHRDFLGQ